MSSTDTHEMDDERRRMIEGDEFGIQEKESLTGEHKKGSVAGTIFNILSNVVGGGVLALPYAFAHTGFVLGTILLYTVGGLSGYAMYILMTCSHRLHTNDEPNAFSYKAMMIRAYGHKMGKVVEAVIVFYTFGCCVAYATVTGTSLAPIAKDWLGLSGIWESRITWTLLAGALFAICSSVRSVTELKFTSVLAFVTIIYVVIVVVIRLIDPESGHPHVDSSVKAFDFGTDIFRAIPLFSVSYGCHYNIPVFYEDLEDRNPTKMRNIIMVAIIIISSTYTVIAYAGYLHFGSQVPSYILQYSGSGGSGSESADHQFGANDTIVNIARLGMFFHFAFVYPLICVACRRSINLFLNRDLDAIPWIQLILQSALIVACSVGLSIAMGDIGVILDFSGSLFGVFLILTFPGLLMIKLSKDDALFPTKPNLIISYCLVVCGLIFTVCGTVMTTIGVADGSS
eukprot:TRINITY_DN5475_c1_g1_i1.p1 TRINITY_DN5475_c1_g1~~TRINITY_DN5475_c1_g1_i1.p1  ORF type:complete len:455 (+),score=105.63 TRINITY_DN5475_c1_g1_i1:50-1414(+)